MTGSAVYLVPLLMMFGVAMATIDIGMGVKYESPNCTASNQTFYPHTLCHKFYQCVNGSPQTRYCRPFTYFDRAQLVCRPMAQVDCELPATTAPTTTRRINFRVQPAIHRFPMQCPETGRYMLRHEDCSSFYLCDEGAMSVQRCKNQQRFDPIRRECVAAWTVNCSSSDMEPVYENALE